MTVVAPHPGYGLRIYFRGTWRLCENDVVAIFQRHAFDNAVVEDDCGFVVKVADTFQVFFRRKTRTHERKFHFFQSIVYGYTWTRIGLIN